MFKRKMNIVLALAVCALLLSVTVSAKNQVTRPMQLSGSGILSVTGESTWEATESGQATHLGRYTLVENGTFSPDWLDWVGEGTFTAANGDKLDFTVEIICVGLEQIGWMDFTGGTGRFADATGLVDLVSVTNPVTGSYTISGTGTIAY